jgi:hypothetical protein
METTTSPKLPQVHSERWHSPKTFATTLLLLFVDRYGGGKDPDYECLKWDPVTIENELADDFGPVPQANLDRLMAAITIATDDRFYTSLPDFITLCNILSGDTYDPTVFDPADVMECAWGLAEGVIMASPDENDPDPYDPEIVAYMAEICKMEGMIAVPAVMRMTVGEDAAVAFNKISGQFSDDPEMFAAIAENEYQKAEEVNSRVKLGLKALFQQLRETPLQFGNTADVADKVLKRLQTLTPGR